MFEALQQIFASAPTASGSGSERDIALPTATAALLIEVARADFDRSSVEMKTIQQLLGEHFHLAPEQTQQLMNAARTESDESASLYRFTHALHAHLDAAEKRRVIGMLWRVALADNVLDKYEDSVMHKIADLIYVPHGQLMAIKNQVLEQARTDSATE